MEFKIGSKYQLTEFNANQAIDAANQREMYLKGIMSKKNCDRTR